MCAGERPPLSLTGPCHAIRMHACIRNLQLHKPAHSVSAYGWCTRGRPSSCVHTASMPSRLVMACGKSGVPLTAEISSESAAALL